MNLEARGARETEVMRKSMVDDESSVRHVGPSGVTAATGMRRSAKNRDSPFGGVVPVGGDNEICAGVAVGFDRKGVGDAEDVSFSGVSAADEDSAVGDGGPEKGSVPVWAHVCPLRRGENTRRRGIGFSGFGCANEVSTLGAYFGGGGGSSDGASGPSAVMSVGERKKFARAEVGFGGGHNGVRRGP